MKVDVIQIEQAKFKSRWHWWSNWIDVAVFDYDNDGHLLQMKISRSNAKKFTCKRFGDHVSASTAQAGNLTQMSASNDKRD